MELRQLLSLPGVAGTLGFLVGVAMIAATAWSRNRSKPSDSTDSIVPMMVSVIGGMLVSSALMIAYVVVARDGFVYFGLALAGGFVIGLGVISIVLWRKSFRD